MSFHYGMAKRLVFCENVFCDARNCLTFPLSTGMVFLSFPAADVAADAVETLKMSTVDGKELYTKVLPNIHVSRDL